MSDDREIARRALDMQNRAREFRMMDLPQYVSWSKRKLAEGESAALIAHLDAMSMSLLPEDAPQKAESDFDEMLRDLKVELGID